MDTTFLKRRGGSWSVRVPVPKHLQARFGKSDIVKALGTKSQREAMRLRWNVVAEIQQSFGPRSKLPDLAEALEFAKELETARAEAPSTDDGLSSAEIYAGLAADRAEALEQSRGTEAARRWYDIAVNRAMPLSVAVDRWLSEVTKYTQQTRQQHRAAVAELKVFLGDVPLRAVDRAAAGRFVSDHLMLAAGLKTLNRKVSSLSTLWKWAYRRGHVSENPWLQQGASKAEAHAQSNEVRPYSPDELRRLLIPGPKTQDLGDLMMLALFLGARINELCELTPADIADGGVHIQKGKTGAATRWLPIPEAVRAIIHRRAQNSEWLFPEAAPGGRDKKRSWNIGKRANRALKKVVPGGREITFHSFRHAYSTACEQARLHNATHDELMGHKKATLALSLYSGGQSRDQLIEAQREVEAIILRWLSPPEV